MVALSQTLLVQGRAGAIPMRAVAGTAVESLALAANWEAVDRQDHCSV